MRLPSFESISKAIRISFVRFPFAILLSTACCFLLMYLVENEPARGESIPFRVLVSLAIGFPLMIGIQLLAEQFSEKPLYRYLFYAAGFLIVLLYYLFLSPDFNIIELIRPVRFISFFITVHLFVSIGPFLRGGNVNDFWEYNKSIFIQWFVGALYATIIFAGLAVAVLATDQLFDLDINEKIYAHLFFIILTIFHPLYFTSNFPVQIHNNVSDNSEVKAIKNLVLFILIPLSMLYFLILYAYGFKILFTWNLPKGWVSSLVIGFSIVGTLSYLLNYRLPDVVENSFIRWFKKWYFYILFPLVVLLYIAIFKRIGDYGFTPERYFVLLTGIWLTILSGYFIISKRDNIKWIPASLMLFLVIGTYSPIDAFRVSTQSQVNRLKEFLNSKSMIKNDKIIKVPNKLNSDENYKLNTMLTVLKEMQGLEKVNLLLDKPVYPKLDAQITEGQIMAAIGADSVYYNNPAQYLNYNCETEIKVKLEDYQELIPLTIYRGGIYEGGVQLKDNQEVLLIKEAGKVIDEFSIYSMVRDLEIKYGKQKERMSVDQCSYRFESKLYKIKLVFSQISIEKKGDDYDISSINGFVLLSKK